MVCVWNFFLCFGMKKTKNWWCWVEAPFLSLNNFLIHKWGIKKREAHCMFCLICDCIHLNLFYSVSFQNKSVHYASTRPARWINITCATAHDEFNGFPTDLSQIGCMTGCVNVSCNMFMIQEYVRSVSWFSVINLNIAMCSIKVKCRQATVSYVTFMLDKGSYGLNSLNREYCL